MSYSFPFIPATTDYDPGLELDFDSFTHSSPGSTDFTFSSASPESNNLISPKAYSIESPEVVDFSTLNASIIPVIPEITSEALGLHHLNRYLHYKALAAQVEAITDPLDALIASYGDKQEMNPFFTPVFQQVQPSVAAMHHAQAQAHLQAHDAAVAKMRPVYRYEPAPPMWTTQSLSTASVASVTTPAGQDDGENELESDDGSFIGENTARPIANPKGGGRGYVPGKTPDDPKKRHKCSTCGRGFARAFNLKVSQNDPMIHRITANLFLSLTSKPTTLFAPNPINALTPCASADSPACTTSSDTVRVSTLTDRSWTPNVRVCHLLLPVRRYASNRCSAAPNKQE